MSKQTLKSNYRSLALAGLGAVILVLLVGGAVYAQTGGLTLPWFTVDGGGITSASGGGYSLSGSIGQPDAGLLSGGSYRLGGGMWPAGGSVDQPYHQYLPVTRR